MFQLRSQLRNLQPRKKVHTKEKCEFLFAFLIISVVSYSSTLQRRAAPTSTSTTHVTKKIWESLHSFFPLGLDTTTSPKFTLQSRTATREIWACLKKLCISFYYPWLLVRFSFRYYSEWTCTNFKAHGSTCDKKMSKEKCRCLYSILKV